MSGTHEKLKGDSIEIKTGGLDSRKYNKIPGMALWLHELAWPLSASQAKPAHFKREKLLL